VPSAGDRSAARPRREVEQVKGVAADLEQVEEAAAARCFLSLPPSLGPVRICIRHEFRESFFGHQKNIFNLCDEVKNVIIYIKYLKNILYVYHINLNICIKRLVT
jgi:hypothetical protein